MHFAARWNHRREIKLLLERGADIRVVDNKGRTTLHYAADHYSTEAAEVLLEGGADVHAIDNEGYTPLHLAQSRGYGEVVNLLQQIAIQRPNSNMNNVNVKNLYGPGMSRNY